MKKHLWRILLQPLIFIMNGHCEPSPDYQKRYTFRLRTQDGAEYLFSAPNEVKMHDWVANFGFHAALPPSLQLKSFDDKYSTDLPQYCKGLSASPPKSSTLPPNTTPSTPPPFIESHSGSLKPQPPPRAQKSGCDFVAWSERGQSSSPDRQDSSDTSREQKRGSKKIFGGLFKGKKHRESKDLSK